MHPQNLVPVAPSGELAQQPSGEWAGVCLPPPPDQSEQLHPCVGAQVGPVTRRLGQRPPLRERSLGVRKSALFHLDAQLHSEGDQQGRKCTPVTQLRHPALLQLVSGRVVVHQDGGQGDGGEIGQGVVGDRPVASQRRDGPAKECRASNVTALAHGREAVQQKIGHCRL